MRKIIDLQTGNVREQPYTAREIQARIDRENKARIRAEAEMARAEARLQDIEDLKRATQVDQVVRIVARLIEGDNAQE